jgi:hypothetical protein
MDEEKKGGAGKVVGGAVVGIGGIIAAIAKGGAHEAGVVAKGASGVAHGAEVAGAGARAAGAGERGLIGVGRGAVAAGALEQGALAGSSVLRIGEDVVPLERAALGGAADAHLTPFASAPQKAAPKLAPAQRSMRIREIIAKAKPDEPAELLEHLGDAIDLGQNVASVLSDDDEKEIDKKLAASGLDFDRDVVPSLHHDAVEGLDGAKRMLLTDGHALVLAMSLPDAALPGTPIFRAERLGAILRGWQGRPSTVYVEDPLHVESVDERKTGAALVTALADSPGLEWHAIPSNGALRFAPPMLEAGGKRFRMLGEAPSWRDRPVSAIVLIGATK